MNQLLKSSVIASIVFSLAIGIAAPVGANTGVRNELEKNVSESIEILDTLEKEGTIETALGSNPTVATGEGNSELQNGTVGLKTDSGNASIIAGEIATIADDHSIVYESLESGDARAVIKIDSPESPKEYSFEMTGEYDSLVKREDGGIDALDDRKNIVASIDSPWAYDAKGEAVPTHFTISGKTITQVVEHDESFEYGIVADPTLRKHIKKVIAGCLGVQADTFTVWGVLEATFTSWNKAIKFLVRRIGLLGAVSCLGGIVYEYL